MSEYTEDGLEIPPYPETSEPILQLGWQWVDAHWAAYWMMRDGFPLKNNLRMIPCSQIKPWVESLLLWQRHSKGRRVYEKILKTPQILNESILASWMQEAGFLGEEYEMSDELRVSFFQTLQFFTCVEFIRHPIQFNLDTRSFSDGRHRVYAAWLCRLTTIFVLVKP